MVDDDAFRKGLGLASRLGVKLVVTTFVGAVGGYGLDRWLGTGPWLAVIGLLLGAAAGFLAVYLVGSRSY